MKRSTHKRSISALNLPMTSQKESISGIEIRHGLITIAQYFPQENSVGSIIIKPMSDASGQDFDGVLKTEFKNLMAEIDFKDRMSPCLCLPNTRLLKNSLLTAMKKTSARPSVGNSVNIVSGRSK